MDLNEVTLIGNVVRSPKSKELRAGEKMICLRLAINCAWQDPKTKVRRQVVDFHDVVAWGELGDIIVAYVPKGAKVYVEGRLRVRRYVGRGGPRRLKSEIVADNMILLGHRAVRSESVTKAVNAEPVREDVDGGSEGEA